MNDIVLASLAMSSSGFSSGTSTTTTLTNSRRTRRIAIAPTLPLEGRHTSYYDDIVSRRGRRRLTTEAGNALSYLQEVWNDASGAQVSVVETDCIKTTSTRVQLLRAAKRRAGKGWGKGGSGSKSSESSSSTSRSKSKSKSSKKGSKGSSRQDCEERVDPTPDSYNSDGGKNNEDKEESAASGPTDHDSGGGSSGSGGGVSEADSQPDQQQEIPQSTGPSDSSGEATSDQNPNKPKTPAPPADDAGDDSAVAADPSIPTEEVEQDSNPAPAPSPASDPADDGTGSSTTIETMSGIHCDAVASETAVSNGESKTFQLELGLILLSTVEETPSTDAILMGLRNTLQSDIAPGLTNCASTKSPNRHLGEEALEGNNERKLQEEARDALNVVFGERTASGVGSKFINF